MPSNAKPWTVLALVDWTKDYFTAARLESPRLSAEVLLANCLSCRRIELYTRFQHQPSAEQIASFRSLVKRAAEHEPVAYLVGRKEFYSLDFTVTPDVLIPRPETEGLVSEAIGHLRGLGRPARMWDVCTGSGCVAIAVARQVEEVSVLATDICTEALAVAEANALAHGVQNRVCVRQADLLELPGDVGGAGQFEVITANPPYVAAGDRVAPEVAYEPAKALMAGEDGLDFIRPIVASAGEFITPGGMLAMEFGRGQADDVRNLIAASGCFGEPRMTRDYQGIERIAAAVRR